MLTWAVDRLDAPARQEAYARTALAAWLSDERQPTYLQLVDFAKRVRVPFGLLLLPEPPAETIDLPYFRLGRTGDASGLPVDVVALIQEVQARQTWTKTYLLDQGAEPLEFIGSATLASDVSDLARSIRETLGYSSTWTRSNSSWDTSRRRLLAKVEELGIFVTASGVVGQHNKRSIDPDVLDGFALSDPIAPFIYVNVGSYVAKQIFTIFHELVHLWLGRSAAFDIGLDADAYDASQSLDRVERFCNQVTAEILVPEQELRVHLTDRQLDGEVLQELASHFRVSRMVVLFRARSLKLVSATASKALYAQLVKEYKAVKSARKKGGDSFRTAKSRIGARFAEVLAEAYRSGVITSREAGSLSGAKGKTLVNLLRE